jgi:hypothetical protein
MIRALTLVTVLAVAAIVFWANHTAPVGPGLRGPY